MLAKIPRQKINLKKLQLPTKLCQTIKKDNNTTIKDFLLRAFLLMIFPLEVLKTAVFHLEVLNMVVLLLDKI